MKKLLIASTVALVAFVGYLTAPLGTSLPNTVFLADMTWLEIKEAIDHGKDGVIVPTAGLEQNGLHVVLGKHRYVVRHAVERIARQHGGLLVAPVIDYVPEGNIDPPDGHMRFEGTISIPADVFSDVLSHTARSLRAHGFRRIYFIGDSLGNQVPQTRVATALNAEWKNTDVRVHHIGDYYARNGQVDWLKAQGETDFTIGGHAGIRDTSELLHVHRDGVRPQMIKPKRGLHLGITGASGDASKATAEIGEIMINLKIEAALRQIRELETR